MKRIHIFLISLFFLLTQSILAQNAPHTTVGSILDVSVGAITIPVTVAQFENIGSISLTLDYDPATMNYVGSTANSAFSGMSISGSVPGQIVIGWFAASGAVTLPDGSQLLEIEFSYISGSTSLSWDNTSNDGAKCEYTDEFYNVLIDSPTADFYTDGFVTSHAAPITYAPDITNAPIGAIDVPISIENFSDIGAITLTLEYNPNILTFTGSTPHSSFGGTMLVASSPSSGGKNKVVISWTSAAPVTLADGSTLVGLHFDYAPALFVGNYSELTWLTDGTACDYGDEVFNSLYDQPYEDFYFDGLVTAQLAPATYLPEITNAFPGLINVPISVTGFQDIGSVTLTFEYDASIIEYDSYTPNIVFGDPVTSLSVGNQVNGNDGKIIISYYGAAVTISDFDNIATITFKNYTSGTTTLAWKTDGTACEYGDASYYYLWDNPNEDYYFSGLVAGQVSPKIKADSMIAVSGTQISVPLRVWDFTDISSFSLTIDYDPGVLTYLSASPHPVIASSFTDGASNPGRVSLSWYNAVNPQSLTDETALIYLNFTYNGGTSPLVWYDNGGSCEFAAGIAIEVLYDQPTADYYINGLVEEDSPSPPLLFDWTGSVSADWLDPDNWYSFLVPDNLSAVSIPSSPIPPNWPVFFGDFTVGVQCKSFDLGGSSEMTVTGNMIIEPSHTFINKGAGILRVGGNWLNSGIFNPRTGTVIFTGPLGNIPSGVLPANEVQNYLLTSSPALMTPISGGSQGPSGDNEHSDVNIGFSYQYSGTAYTQLRINTNGWVSLNLSGSDLTSNTNVWLFDVADPTTTLAPWWDDLMADGSSDISYLTSGTAPDRVFTVEWNNLLAYSSGATARLNFQLKLYETTNVAEFCYGTVTAGTHAPNEGASIGIKGPTGGNGDFLEATTATTNTTVINLKCDQDWPSVNYIFTPPSDTLTFNKLTLSSSAILNIQTDVKVTTTTP